MKTKWTESVRLDTAYHSYCFIYTKILQLNRVYHGVQHAHT